jgi:hypothetical protein
MKARLWAFLLIAMPAAATPALGQPAAPAGAPTTGMVQDTAPDSQFVRPMGSPLSVGF